VLDVLRSFFNAVRSPAGRLATDNSIVSRLVWFNQLQATPFLANAIADVLPAFGVKLACNPKFGLKSYIACRDTNWSQVRVTGIGFAVGDADGDGDAEEPALADGEPLGDAAAL
jgi:hypothetical protein